MNTTHHGFMTYPNDMWRKLMFRGPLYLWRMGLAPIFAGKMLVLGMTGRKSGLPRYTMLEYTLADGKKYLASAWGKRSQWYKNVLTDPYVTIQTMPDNAESMTLQRVTDEAELRMLFQYFRHSPVWEIYLDAWDIRPNIEDYLAKKDRLYLLRADPADMPTPPPLEADLKWVWWVVALVALLVAGMFRRLGKKDKSKESV